MVGAGIKKDFFWGFKEIDFHLDIKLPLRLLSESAVQISGAFSLSSLIGSSRLLFLFLLRCSSLQLGGCVLDSVFLGSVR